MQHPYTFANRKPYYLWVTRSPFLDSPVTNAKYLNSETFGICLTSTVTSHADISSLPAPLPYYWLIFCIHLQSPFSYTPKKSFMISIRFSSDSPHSTRSSAYTRPSSLHPPTPSSSENLTPILPNHTFISFITSSKLKGPCHTLLTPLFFLNYSHFHFPT